MSEPREAIMSLRIKNFESRNFVLYELLCGLMDHDLVTLVIGSCEIPVFRKQEIIQLVLYGARKVLAILIVLRQPSTIIRFIERDQFQASKLDSKLPLDLQALQGYLPSHSIALEFYDLQWEFTYPEFFLTVLHRSLDPNTVLPFVGDPKYLGEGGFGTVTEVLLPQPLQEHMIRDQPKLAGLVRKEFKSAGDQVDSGYEREQNNLHILSRLKHPNIVRLINSYKFRGKINFLFPQAQGGNLHELLRTEHRPPQLQTDSSFLLALCHLSSAIATVHSFTIEELDLSMIGCHHDLKPY
ncbi:MAG: hypothetical protein Q9226_006797 [Calogaya cf. arnoldii]